MRHKHPSAGFSCAEMDSLYLNLLRQAEILAIGFERTLDLQSGDECPICGVTDPPCLHKIAAARIVEIAKAS